MATVNIQELQVDYEIVTGNPEIARRLSDKVLAAFNHAYAVGEVDVAVRLKDVLHLSESKRPRGDQRTRYCAIEHAELWVAFVDARNRYRTLSDRKSVRRAELDAALAAMKETYRAWSDA